MIVPDSATPGGGPRRLLMYLTIMWITVSTIIFTLAKNFSLLHYKDNIFSKVLYWPVLYLMILMRTVHVFY